MNQLRWTFTLLASLGLFLSAAPSDDLFVDFPREQLDGFESAIRPNIYRTTHVDLQALRQHLEAATSDQAESQTILSLPKPDGQFQDFLITPVKVMAPALAERYPEIKTWQGIGIGDPTARVRMDLTPQGFHAMVIDPSGTWFIDPFSSELADFAISYLRKDLDNPHQFLCGFQEEFNPVPTDGSASLEGLVEYRIAIAATGEYTQFHGGTVSSGLAAVVTALNRVNMIYERDVALRMILIANNDLLIYTNGATDPYTNSSGVTMLAENQSNIDAVIGSANYDIGHVFSTGGGGVASLGVVCSAGKARGVTGLSQPTGDPFYIDYVAHELGHQWFATHSYNGTAGFCGSNRSGATAYEPGSGSTILSYAGICESHDLQGNSDAHFHPISFDQIVNFTRIGGGFICGDFMILNNTAPVVDAGDQYVIPQQTPFTLTGTAIDAEQTDLLYSWEQFDAGSASAPDVDTGDNAIFRSYPPTLVPYRHFPRLQEILSGTPRIGEHLPTTDRDLTFRLMVRDNFIDGGAVGYDSTELTVTTTAGPFSFTAFGNPQTLPGGSVQRMTWDVAGTDLPPVDCANVEIVLSGDEGLSFSYNLASGTANDGIHYVFLPNEELTDVRIKVACSDNIFFDINKASLEIVAGPVCPNSGVFWREDATGFVETNVNGIIDVLDLVSCL